jgi:hypothetical protein
MSGESFPAYRARVLGYLGGRDPMAVLARTSARLDALISGRSRRVLTGRPAPGRWSAAEIVSHLADAELVFGWRVRTMLANRTVRLPAFDQDRWATAGRYDAQDPRKALELFRVLRRSTLVLLRRRSRRVWRRHVASHELRGSLTLVELVRLEAGHDLNHLRQLVRLVGPARRHSL